MSEVTVAPRKFPGIVERRRRYVSSKVDLRSAELLEVGAMDMPTFYRDEAKISFMDYFSDEDFADLASRGQISRSITNLVHVDLVAKNKYFAAKETRRFDCILAAHVIEHIADPIAWLRELAELLKEGGRIFLCIPDRRFTFDILRRESTGLDLLEAYEKDAVVPDLYTIADFYFFHRSVTAADCWGDPAKLQERLAKSPYTLKSAIGRAQGVLASGDVHVNVHASVFSYPTFSQLWAGLQGTGLLQLQLEEVVDAQPGTNEFWALLRRPPMSKASARVPSKGRKYLEGKNGYLFLDNDTNGVIDQITGKTPFLKPKQDQWIRLLEARSYLLALSDICYIFAVAPAKEVVLSEQLPEGILVSEERPAQILCNRLSETGRVNLVYPLNELRDSASPYQTFFVGDTHWTPYGAFIAYRAILEQAAVDLGFPLVTEAQLQPNQIESFGDLQVHANQSTPERVTGVSIRQSKAVTVMDNRKPNRGRLIIYENSNAPNVRAIVFRDSFTETMLPFLAETFRRLVVVWNPFVDYDLIAQESPNLVINIMAERFLSQVPDDNHRLALEDLTLLRQIRGMGQ